MKFGAFVFDPQNGALTRDGAPLALGHRGGELLRLLLAKRGEIVGKEALLDAAWPNQAVEESNLTVQIATLRKALGTTAEGQDWIATVPRVGYRFLAASAEASRSESEKPVIAVLPFDNVSTDPDQEFFAQGLAEDLITDLSRVSGLMVIARNSSFAMKGRRSDLRGIGADLGASFIVDGSVRRVANKVRINAQLVEAAEQTQLWAERFDGDVSDVFALQDQVVGRIVGALARVLSIGEAPTKRRNVDIEAYDLFVRGRALTLQSREGYLAGHPLLLRATQIDREFAEAFAWLAMSDLQGWLNWGQPREAAMPAALAAATRAVEIDNTNAFALAFLGYVNAFDEKLERGLSELDAALKIDPSLTDALIFRAEVLVHLGRNEEGVISAQESFRLNPYPPAHFYWILAFAQYAAGDYEGVVATLERPETTRTGSRRLLAAALAQLGRMPEARVIVAEYLSVVPNFTIKSWSDGQPLHRDADRQRFVEGYRKAGLPD